MDLPFTTDRGYLYQKTIPNLTSEPRSAELPDLGV
jgi:hypothetical protein